MVAQLACADCSRLFSTKIGLSQHRRHAHPTQHNADKLSRVKHSGARWSQQESQSLLRLANNLYPSCETQTALFARLEQYFPGRSAISIKTRLRVLNWQAQQDESSSGGPDQTIGQIAAYSSEADDYSVWFKQTVDCAVSLLESHADSSLASVDLLAFARGLQSGIMTPEQVLSLLDLHASRTFPHTWKTVSRRRRQLAHRMPVNRKQIRRANYAAIQTLYHQRRKDAASAVLDGSWKDLYKGNCGLPPDAEQYWKQVLSAPKHVDSRPSRVIVPSDWSLIEPITGEEVGRTVRSMGNSSPGLDKLTPRMLRRFNANVSTETRSKGWTTTSGNLFAAGYVYRRIPRSATSMPRRVRMEKLLSTQCRVLRNVVNDSAFGKVVRDLSLPIRVHGSCVNTKEELVAAWGDSLHNSVDGRGLRELVASPLSNRWLVFPERVFSRIFIRGIQLRCNLLRTRVRSARHGHGGQTILCRGNCGQPESLVHILQSCWITHDARCARHNRVARELAKRLRRLGYTVFEELRAPTSTSFIKPDLIAVRERRATVIDVSIVSDGRGMTVCNEKKQKYCADEFSLAIISALRAIGCDVDFLVRQPMIISYRGICFPQSAKAVIGLGLSKVTIAIAQNTVTVHQIYAAASNIEYSTIVLIISLPFLQWHVASPVIRTNNCSHSWGRVDVDVDAAKRWLLDWHLPSNDEKCVHMSFGEDSANSFVVHGENRPEDVTREDDKMDLVIWLCSNLYFSLHHEKSAQKALAVLRMIRRTFSRVTRMDFQRPHTPYVRPLQVIYSVRTKDVTLIERVQRAATKMIAGLKSMDYETRLAVIRRYLAKEMNELSETLFRDTDGQAEVISCENDDLVARFTFRISPKKGPYSHAAFTFTYFRQQSHPASYASTARKYSALAKRTGKSSSRNRTCIWFLFVRIPVAVRPMSYRHVYHLDFADDRQGYFPRITTPDHIYHPNVVAIDGEVEICVNLLDNWTIHMGIRAIVYSFLFLFCEPNYDDVLDDEFVVPEQMTEEEAIRSVLSGGCIFGVQHEPNRAWLDWWEQEHSGADGKYPSPRTIMNCTHTSKPMPHRTSRGAISRIALLAAYSGREEPTKKATDDQLCNVGSRRSSAKSDYQRYVSSDFFTARKPKRGPTHTVRLSEIAVIQFSVQHTDGGISCRYFLAENCIVEEMERWEEMNDAWLNQKTEHDRYEYHQEAHLFPWEMEISEAQRSSLVENESVGQHNTLANPNCIGRTNNHSEIHTLYSKDSQLLKTLSPKYWFLYQTRWPFYLSPGNHLFNSLLYVDWPSTCSYASAGQLFKDVSRLLENHRWSEFSQLLLFDPLALSPASPIINRLIFEPRVKNATVGGLSVDCADWISPLQAVTLELNQWGLRHRIPGQISLCFIAFLHNWVSYLSRLELHHSCFGYSRPGTTAFSVTRRVTDPFALTGITPALLTFGQTPLLDAWPLWLTKSVLRLALHATTKLIQLVNRYYFQCTTSAMADRKGKTGPEFVSYIAFTDVEDL
ncbi:retrovirus-related Pol polyprotein from type-2 retrotransposable element R2DM [Clonorchis sinensis]|uniref:Retrovirus-related Pol polyprotein from type-2 retrotransposable element R2DM n=1 Tax=Clonorchis sinensis TaxID=79923 RepID=G7YGE7_CLOSI|nr:retrovirus-related Pol polyprotein from type-2 retrotransposable element R2DM [Clonorchis sinensis]